MLKKSNILQILSLSYPILTHIAISQNEFKLALLMLGIIAGLFILNRSKQPEKTPNFKNIGVRLSLTHPFMVEFAGDDHKIIEPLLRMVVALGLSEIIVKKSGAPITELRNNMNELLLGSLSKL